ncbi:hypothetical protein VOLCADRAFT_86861 [Volvox carteri f. nagariensis]|uniref:Protein kinase domain-containing protein n=1 Tax=Volvox carteri f. nagariensis TaxID=3068 RepID=D8TJT4_VOLCA|nr:uncharacterized protein VOLCADRAFT_86861 [Volvox carteri f. nagariensis]EFJ52600.1 hypothetical protein VOLCADRAFT_86861 [Volvox carteri f. nagariensis]|eukprot:XP_002946673.1 hypothetical protein VOLCADRAFT_86861 [Volvox carteri f. nagariensis]
MPWLHRAAPMLVTGDVLRCSEDDALNELQSQQVYCEEMNETAHFIESMLSDMKVRALVITTLDTAASLHSLLSSIQSEDAAAINSPNIVFDCGKSALPGKSSSACITAATAMCPTAVADLVSDSSCSGDGGLPPDDEISEGIGSDIQLSVAAIPALQVATSCELTCLGSPGALGGIWLADWRGMRVAVKLTRCDSEGCSTKGGSDKLLRTLVRASRLQHPNLINVYDLRVATVDEEALSELDPPPVLRPGWTGSCRPTGRLHRFLAAHPELPRPEPDYRRDAPLTLYPGDIIARRPKLTQVQQALMAGSLQSLACSDRSPFRASRFWVARVARRALLRTAREIAAGMRALHAAGITHAADRRGFMARITDVGSMSLSYAASNPLAFGPCMVLLPPEVLGDNTVAVDNAAVDVYAFGMLLYVMAAGEMPFHGRPLVQALMAVVSEGLRPEWPMCEHAPLKPLFLRCVAQRPDERPSFKQEHRDTARLVNCRWQAAEFRAMLWLRCLAAYVNAPAPLQGLQSNHQPDSTMIFVYRKAFLRRGGCET